MNEHVMVDAVDAERMEVVRSAERLAQVAPAWTELWHRVDGLIFQSHGWISAWWETVPDRKRRDLRIGLIWNGDRLVAVMPLAISRRRGLRFLEWAASSYTDYGDALVAPECPASALRRLWVLLSASGGFDLAFLNRLLPDAAVRPLIAPGASGGIRLRPNYRQEMSYRVAGRWQSGAAWYDGQSKKTRKNYRHSLNMMGETGKLQFRLLPADEPLGPMLVRLAALKRKWLAEHARESELFDEDAPALAALVETMARAGVLRVFVLECDGLMIAVSINFVQRNTMMAFVTTYDPDFGRASPGLILMMDYIRWSMDQGLATVDFLCGAEAFKQRFATESVTLQSFMGIRSARGALAVLADRAREAIRARRNRRLAATSGQETQAEAGN
jgi:CelD/BcsL family acetyltransferase involved in cellulose biosynthesis